MQISKDKDPKEVESIMSKVLNKYKETKDQK